MNIFNNTEIAFKSHSNMDLKKAFYLFKSVENSWLTSLGIRTIRFLINIHFPIKSAIKSTLFKHFCGGESLEDCNKTIKKLSQYHIYSILDYSVEGKDEEQIFENAYHEIIRNIIFSSTQPDIPFVVFKPTAFGRIEIYEKIGLNQNLTEAEKQEWHNIQRRFQGVGEKAAELNVTVMVDAEESWMQDAADDLVTDLMKRFNKQKCIICNTVQMYRKGRFEFIKSQYEKAIENNYIIGFKVVRGAYMEKERERAILLNYASPIQDSKDMTDKDYNSALRFIIEHIDTISLFAGTHNEESCDYLMQLIIENKIDKAYHKIWFGQLLGMSDNISFNLAYMGYNVAKYVPYGPVLEVIPYLMRRAMENTSVQGQTGRELRLIQQELKRRKINVS